MNSRKDEVKLVLEKMEKQKEESEKKFEDEKKLTEANTKSLQAELQSKQDVSSHIKNITCRAEFSMLFLQASVSPVVSKIRFVENSVLH